MSTLHKRTPEVAVLDNRGLTVRTVTYHRHPETPAATDERIIRHQYDARGTRTSSADPRLHAAGLVNFRYISDLNGEALLNHGVDNGTTTVLRDAAGRPLLTVTADGVMQRVQYESADLPGRALSMTEQVSGAVARITDRFVYAGNSETDKIWNLAGVCIRHYDTAGLMQTDSISLTGTPLSVTRRLLKDADNPDTVADWQGGETSAWNDLTEAEDFITLTTTDATGVVLTTTDAKGNLQRVAYDVAGLLSGSWLTLKDGKEQTIVTSLTYSAAGQKLREVHGNGVVTTYEYEPETQRLTGIKTERPAGHKSGQKILQDLRYEYDPVGNVLKITNDAEETRFWRNQKVVPENTYVYDSLYQLISATGREMASIGQQGSSLPSATIPLPTDSSAFTNYTRTYTYDNAGNLTQVRHSPATGNGYTTKMTVSDRSNRGVLGTLTENPSDVDALFTAGGQQKQLQPGQNLTWTPRNELLKVTPVVREGGTDDRESYRYDAGSQRILKVSVQKTGNSTQTQHARYLPGLELRGTKSGSTETEGLQVITVGEAGRAQVRVLHWESGAPTEISNDQVRYNYDNLTGSSSLELDGDGNVISMEEYYPYGGTAVWTARSQREADYKTVRYSGKERDATGLYYYGYRYYQPWAGRWLSADPAGTVDGLNLFRMCRNNPISGIDSDGRMFKRMASIRQQRPTTSLVTIPDYPLPKSDRVKADDVSLSRAEILKYKKAISEGEYPQNLIRYNFLYGKEDLPEPVNIPQEFNKEEINRETITGNFLQAVDKLTSYAGGKVMYRGTLVPDEHFKSLKPGTILQSHQFSFFSESDLVSRAFIDSSESGNFQPVMFKVKDVPANVFKEGFLSPDAYDDLKTRLSKKGVDAKKLRGIGSTAKELIAVPGTLFEVVQVKKIKSDIHKNELTQVKLKFFGKSNGVHDRALF